MFFMQPVANYPAPESSCQTAGPAWWLGWLSESGFAGFMGIFRMAEGGGVASGRILLLSESGFAGFRGIFRMAGEGGMALGRFFRASESGFAGFMGIFRMAEDGGVASGRFLLLSESGFAGFSRIFRMAEDGGVAWGRISGGDRLIVFWAGESGISFCRSGCRWGARRFLRRGGWLRRWR